MHHATPQGVRLAAIEFYDQELAAFALAIDNPRAYLYRAVDTGAT